MKKYSILLFLFNCSIMEDVPLVGPLFEDGKEIREENNNRFLLGVLYRSNLKNQATGINSATESYSSSECAGINTTNTTTVDNSIYTVGYKQVSSNNQDAFAKKTTSAVEIWNRANYDTSSDDSRGETLIADSSNLFVAFSVTGGNTGFSNFVSTDAIQKSYGSGGGPKITFLAKIDINTGDILRGTFLGARLSDGKTNTLRPCSLQISGTDEISFVGETAYDAGVATDSLQKNTICQSGSIRRIKMNFQLNTITSISCEPKI